MKFRLAYALTANPHYLPERVEALQSKLKADSGLFATQRALN